MEEDITSLTHTKWRCQYHLVFAPKYRRKIIYGKYKLAIGKILRRIIERIEGAEIIEPKTSENYEKYVELFYELRKHKGMTIAKAKEITKGITDDYKKVLAIHDWVSDNIWYDQEYLQESFKNGSMYIHHPNRKLSTAENILLMMRPDQKYTMTEAKVLDTALILHMEHGGGNNSTFTTRVVTSSGSDTYSTIAAAMSSLKGPKHGGANIKVMEMMDDIREQVKDYKDKDEIAAYLSKIIDKQAFDQKGLVYGMGHAVYSLSDPRERVFKYYVEQLAKEKDREEDLQLYENIEEIKDNILDFIRKYEL